MPPYAATAACTRRSASAACVTSPATATTAAPPARSAAAAAASASCPRAQIVRRAPSAAKPAAIAWPSPRLAPVTITDRPASPSSIARPSRCPAILPRAAPAVEARRRAPPRPRVDAPIRPLYARPALPVAHGRPHEEAAVSAAALSIDGPLATITLAPPAGLFDRAASEALRAAAERVAGEREVRVVIVRAGAADFGSGWSAQALAEPQGTPGLPSLGAGIEALAAIPQPVVALIAGRAHSAGLEVALACDVRLAAEGATFAMPDTAAGGVPRGGGTQRLPRTVGRAQALRLLLTGEVIDAAEARRIGLVSRVVPWEELAAAGRALAEAIAARGPLATRLAKEAVHRGAEMTLEQALRYETDLTVLLQSTADRAEGVAAFAARRAPRFIGE
ncbi:MAG: hypothetical protein EXR65_05235 [Dehalococcoidia bacterium]|nr:hypothetical protein [Dehalococcoidia bacterium]